MKTFDHLSDGARLYQTFEAAKVASANAYTSPQAAERIAADEQQSCILPTFGHRLKETRVRDENAFGGTRLASYWLIQYPFQMFWTSLNHGLRTAVERESHADGTITERLAANAVQTAWQQACDSAWSTGDPMMDVYGADRTVPRPMDAHAPLHIAAALASFGGLPWTLSTDGEAVERVLPAQPLRYPAGGAQPRTGQLKNGLLFPCVGWAFLPAGSAANEEGENALVYVSGVGPQKKLKAVWAALMDNKRDLLNLPSNDPGKEFVRARRPDGKGVFDTFWNEEPLPDSGLAHLAIQHRSMLHPRPGQPFLHLTGADGTPDLALFARQMDAASTYPIQPDWVERLWNVGLERKLITELPSYGCTAFWVNVRDEAAWGTIVAQCAGAREATVESYGDEPSNAPQVSEVETAA